MTDALSPDQTSAILAELDRATPEQLAAMGGPEAQATSLPAETLEPQASAVAPTEPPQQPPETEDELARIEREIAALPPFSQVKRQFELTLVGVFSGQLESFLHSLPPEERTEARFLEVRADLLEMVALAILHGLAVNMQSQGIGLDRLSEMMMEAGSTPTEVFDTRFAALAEKLKKIKGPSSQG